MLEERSDGIEHLVKILKKGERDLEIVRTKRKREELRKRNEQEMTHLHYHRQYTPTSSQSSDSVLLLDYS